jgi:hypothetical protein
MHNKVKVVKKQTVKTYNRAIKDTKMQVGKVDGMPRLPTIKKRPRIPSIV